MRRTACPLCGCRRMEPRDDEFVNCTGCRETLYPAELVRFATRFTRRRYNAANGHSPDYR